jgi:D-serine dehydratase
LPTSLNNPVFAALQQRAPLLWINPALAEAGTVLATLAAEQQIGIGDMLAAEALLQRWSGVLAALFPQLQAQHGLIESPLLALDSVVQVPAILGATVPGKVWVKADHALPVAGSVKARGGIYEVLALAESLALRAGLLRPDEHPVLTPALQGLFSQHTVAVGSTGNLGLAIGVMASALGFRAVVHMSRDAKQWKKDRLRQHGVDVIEHAGDYAAAVESGRQQAVAQPNTYFVDDENSRSLFLGYAVAALRLRRQLDEAGITVDARHPLLVYLPCGVGGAPGGITFGLKQVFGDTVHCFFAEPCASPAMLVRMLSGATPLSVYDIGLDNVTEADGLAVASASELVYSLVRNLLSGVFTVADDELFRTLLALHQHANVRIEPSAAAGFAGPCWLTASEAGRSYLGSAGLTSELAGTTHLIWSTGGLFVPEAEYRHFLEQGRQLQQAGTQPYV